MNYYEILDVPVYATTEDIVIAYRAKAMTAHPDRGGSVDEFTKLNMAYKTLRDPKTRMRYDEKRKLKEPKCSVCFGAGYKWKQVSLRVRKKIKCPRCDGTGTI